MAGPRTLWLPGMSLTPERLNSVGWQTGKELVSFTSLEVYTFDVVFDEPYVGTPVVMAQIQSGSGVAARWFARAINTTPTGFTFYLAKTDAAGAAVTWANIPVVWTAHDSP